MAEGERRQLKAADVEKQRILQELMAIAFVKPILAMFGPDGKILPPQQWPEEVHATIRSFEVVVRSAAAGNGHQDTVIKVSFWNKVAALEQLGKHYGVAQGTEDTNVTCPPLNRSRSRVRISGGRRRRDAHEAIQHGTDCQ